MRESENEKRNDSVFTDEEKDSIASRMKRKRRRNRQPEDDDDENFDTRRENYNCIKIFHKLALFLIKWHFCHLFHLKYLVLKKVDD